MNRLLTKNFKLHITSTGAGSKCLDDLWKIPGCSSFLTGFSFPYASSQTEKLLGYLPLSFVSESVSLDLAAHSFMEAWKCRESEAQEIIGIGATSSVASIKEHRGDHRAFVSLISSNGIFASSINLPKGSGERQREIDGHLVDALIKTMLLLSLDLNASEEQKDLYQLGVGKRWQYGKLENGEMIEHLFARPFFRVNGKRETDDNLKIETSLFYPGHFNPLHWGHSGFAEEVESLDLQKRKTIFTTTINPPHKAPLTPQQILQRVAQMEGRDFLLTRDDATFLEKARKFPGSSFLMGADTLERILDPKWGHEIVPMMKEFKDLGTSLFVSDRMVDGKLLKTNDVLLGSEELRKISLGDLPAIVNVEGRWDISSTELRNKK